jgi:transcriptional regulator with XRE-family HTH domain
MNQMPDVRRNHIGRNIERFRRMRGIKQDAIGTALGISQQAVSDIEQSESIDEEQLKKIAQVLGVTPDAIRYFSEENMVNYFNTFNDNDFSNSNGTFGTNSTFNPIEKLVELFEENKNLYERLLQSEREKVDLLSTSLKK